MERVMGLKEECNCYTDFDLIDQVLDWLERKDGDLELMVGYGLCLVAAAYFAAHLVLALMRW